MLRITLDINQLVRALMRPPELATFVMAWQSRRFTIVCSRPLLEEYLLVLDCPEIAELIYPEVRRVFLTQLLALLEIIDLPEIPAICRDPADDKVLATALWGDVDYLVTADHDLTTPAVTQMLYQEGTAHCTIDDLLHLLDRGPASST
jgi:putative PIN family toxin of toxin-antitoxin system